MCPECILGVTHLYLERFTRGQITQEAFSAKSKQEYWSKMFSTLQLSLHPVL